MIAGILSYLAWRLILRAFFGFWIAFAGGVLIFTIVQFVVGAHPAFVRLRCSDCGAMAKPGPPDGKEPVDD